MKRIIVLCISLMLVHSVYGKPKLKKNIEPKIYEAITFLGYEMGKGDPLSSVIEKIGKGTILIKSDNYQRVCYLGSDGTIIEFFSSSQSKAYGSLTGVSIIGHDSKEDFKDCVKHKSFNKKSSFSNGINLTTPIGTLKKVLDREAEEDGFSKYGGFFEYQDTLHMYALVKNGKISKISLLREEWDY